MAVSERQVAAEIERLSGQDVRETRLRLALGAARMGTWERNLLTGKDIWSAQQQELFGLKPGSFSDTHQAFLGLVHPDDRQGLENSVRRALEGDEYHSEYRIILPDGTVRWMAGTGDVIRDSEGRPTHMVGVTMDITSRKLAEEERAKLFTREQAARRAAEEADRTKDAFLATVSHELRTPLTAILGWAQLLQRETFSPDEATHGLKTIERNARSMSQLVEDVLDVSRIITGKLWLRSEAVDLGGVIDAAIDAVRHTAQSKSVRLERHLANEPIIVTGDPGRIQQVVWNLLTNAVKFTPAGGSVRVELARADGRARITVSDTGEGIPASFLPHLFQRFTQADNSSRRPHSGLGLGLAIVHQLVELHHGSVVAHSPGPGMGSTFTVELPTAAQSADSFAAAPAAPEPESLPRAEPGALNGVEVLIVDDDPDALHFIGKVLSGSGARITAAGSAAEAITCFERQRPAVLLSDIAMPGEDGYDLIQKIRQKELAGGCAPVPACALTAFAREEDRRRALAVGYHVHVAKPFEPADLIAAVAGLAAGARKPAVH